MTAENTLSVPVVQMSHVEKIVEVVQNQPHVQQLVAQETARSELKKENSQVPEVSPSMQGRRVRGQKDGQNRQGSRHQGSRQDTRRGSREGSRKDGWDAPSDEPGEGPGSSDAPPDLNTEAAARPDEELFRGTTNPWAGHIVNVKI